MTKNCLIKLATQVNTLEVMFRALLSKSALSTRTSSGGHLLESVWVILNIKKIAGYGILHESGAPK
jgi:hypothetical protein